tara:strand:+ start:138 stop:758 length:621 start_codon:yes stop_codon:yes gene_type:complete
MKKILLPLFILLSSKFHSQHIAGKTNFNISDRIAISDVIDAYGFYWDSNNLDKFLSLFTDDATGVIYNKGEKVTYKIKSKEQVRNSQERMSFFIQNNMQRRHMMSNTLILELTEEFAHLEQYMTLLTTNQNTNTEFVTPILYRFKLRKINELWKITSREINFDKPLDLELNTKKKYRKGMLLPKRGNGKVNKTRNDYKRGINQKKS